MRLGAERAHKARALRVGNTFHNYRPARLAQLVEHRLRRRDDYLHWPRGFAGLDCCSFCGRTLHGSAGSPAGCASCSCCSCCSHGFYSHQAALTSPPGFVLVSTALLPSLNDLLIRTFVPAGFLTQRRESPGRLRVIALDLAFAAPVRMIHRVHAHAAHGGLDAAPPRASGLAESFIFMVKVANLADRSHAIDGKLAHFA